MSVVLRLTGCLTYWGECKLLPAMRGRRKTHSRQYTQLGVCTVLTNINLRTRRHP